MIRKLRAFYVPVLPARIHSLGDDSLSAERGREANRMWLLSEGKRYVWRWGCTFLIVFLLAVAARGSALEIPAVLLTFVAVCGYGLGLWVLIRSVFNLRI